MQTYKKLWSVWCQVETGPCGDRSSRLEKHHGILTFELFDVLMASSVQNRISKMNGWQSEPTLLGYNFVELGFVHDSRKAREEKEESICKMFPVLQFRNFITMEAWSIKV